MKKQTNDSGQPSAPERHGKSIQVAAPQTGPPGYMPPHAEEEAVTAAIWRRNQRVTGLWSKNETRNSWISIANVGWRKLANTTDSGNAALAVLASQALATGRPVDYREEADGMIHEIYLW